MLVDSRKAPSITEVFIVEFCFSTPRIIMHMCWASITTATPGGVGHLLNRFGDLPGEVFLDLQATGEHVDDARDLRQAEHFAGGDVGDVGLADEGQQVVLAQRIQLDVLDDHHLVVVGGEQRAVDDLVQRLLVAVAEVLHGLGGALGRIQQAFAFGIFTEADEDFAVMLWQRQWVIRSIPRARAYLTCRPPLTVRVVPVT